MNIIENVFNVIRNNTRKNLEFKFKDDILLQILQDNCFEKFYSYKWHIVTSGGFSYSFFYGGKNEFLYKLVHSYSLDNDFISNFCIPIGHIFKTLSSHK